MIFTKIRKVKSPERGSSGSAGIDFFIPFDILEDANFIEKYSDYIEYGKLKIPPMKDVLIPSGIKVIIPAGSALVAMNKSGISTKKHVIKGAELIDSDYRGEVHFHLFNISEEYQIFEPGMKIIQFIHLEYFADSLLEIDEFDYEIKGGFTDRGTGGFGSTGIK